MTLRQMIVAWADMRRVSMFHRLLHTQDDLGRCFHSPQGPRLVTHSVSSGEAATEAAKGLV